MQAQKDFQIFNLVKRLILFSICAAFGYAILVYVFGNLFRQKYLPNFVYKFDHNYLRLQEVEQTTDIDILFLGSSHSYRGFDTRIFTEEGYKVFNLGSSSQTPKQTAILLGRYLDRLNPKLVVYEVNPIMLTSDGVESTLNLITSDKNDAKLFHLVAGLGNIKVINAYIFNQIETGIGYKPEVKDTTYHSGGFVSRNQLSFYKKENYDEDNIVMRQDQLKKFRDIIELLKEKNMNYILVQAPITSEKYQSYSNMRIFSMTMKSYGDYYDFNIQLQLNDTIDFYDSHHLNQTGVKIFNEALLEVLESKYPNIIK